MSKCHGKFARPWEEIKEHCLSWMEREKRFSYVKMGAMSAAEKNTETKVLLWAAK